MNTDTEIERIKKGLSEKLDLIAESVANKKDIEIRKTKNGITIAEKTIRILSK